MDILVIGAGHVGRAATKALAERHDIVVVTRRTDPAVDLTDRASIGALFDRIGPVDAVVVTVGAVPFAAFAELTADDYASAVSAKVLAQIDVVRLGLPFVRDGGSITLTTGVLAREPVATGAAASMTNGALEAFVMAVATELPRGIRINAVSPSVLESASGYHATFPGFRRVTDAEVGAAFVRSVDGVVSGRVLVVD